HPRTLEVSESPGDIFAGDRDQFGAGQALDQIFEDEFCQEVRLMQSVELCAETEKPWNDWVGTQLAARLPVAREGERIVHQIARLRCDCRLISARRDQQFAE